MRAPVISAPVQRRPARRPSLRAVGAVLVAVALAGCAGGAPSESLNPTESVSPSPAPLGADIGNVQPRVSYDDLMIRRRIAVAIYGLEELEVPRLRESMDLAGADRTTGVSEISPNVLDESLLESAVPEITLVLPANITLADATGAARTALRQSDVTVETNQYVVSKVLVHDLRFTISSSEPAALRGAIADEGILSDALGTYTSSIGAGELSILYTGTLLSDEVIESVRAGMARAAGAQAENVTVLPRSSAGVGVDMATEPLPGGAVGVSAPDHHGLVILAGDGSAGSDPASGPGLGIWSFVLFISSTALVVALSVVFRRRRSTAQAASATGKSAAAVETAGGGNRL